MRIAPFQTEHFFARYEFNTPYQLCNSDCETVTIDELLALAGTSLADLGALALGYTESQGDPALRRAIAGLYESVAPDDVIVLGTPVEGIYLAARALLDPGDEVVVLTPAYDALINLFEHVAGADRVRRWAFRPTPTGWRLDLDELRTLLTPHTRLLVLNFPHNPTGYTPTPEELTALIALAAEYDVQLFYDEMYYGLFHDSTPVTPSAADVSRGAVVLSGLSKTYGLPGLRTGWLIVRDRQQHADIMNWKFYTSICPPAPSEFLARAALSVADVLRRRSLDQIAVNRASADAFFARWPDHFVWRPPLAGSTALVAVNLPSLGAASVTALSERLAAEAGVLIHPAVTLGADERFMRLGLGRAGFGAALSRFEAYLARGAG